MQKLELKRKVDLTIEENDEFIPINKKEATSPVSSTIGVTDDLLFFRPSTKLTVIGSTLVHLISRLGCPLDALGV